MANSRKPPTVEVFTLVVWDRGGWAYDSGPFPTRVQAAEQRTLAYKAGLAKRDVKIVPHPADEDVESIIARWKVFWLLRSPNFSSSENYFASWNEEDRPTFGYREEAVVFNDREVALGELRRIRRAETGFWKGTFLEREDER